MGSGISSKTSRKSNSDNPAQINSASRPLASINANSSSFQSNTSHYNETLVDNHQPVVPLLVSIDISSNNVSSIPSFIPYTPQGVDKDIYKYYCPLCMQYFKEMTKTVCCSNSICKNCILDFCQSKHMIFNNGINISDVINKLSSYNKITCPNCQVLGFHVLYVDDNHQVRDYTQTTVTIQLDRETSNQSKESPLRIGESFENLKRKMIKFKSNDNNLDNNNHSNDVIIPSKELDNDIDYHINNQLIIDENYSTPRIHRNISINTGIAIDINNDMVDHDSDIPLTPYSNDGNYINRSTQEDDTILSPLNSSYHLSAQNSPLYISSSTTHNTSINSSNMNLQHPLVINHSINQPKKSSKNQEDSLESISLSTYDYNSIEHTHQVFASILVKQMFQQVLNNHQ